MARRPTQNFDLIFLSCCHIHVSQNLALPLGENLVWRSRAMTGLRLWLLLVDDGWMSALPDIGGGANIWVRSLVSLQDTVIIDRGEALRQNNHKFLAAMGIAIRCTPFSPSPSGTSQDLVWMTPTRTQAVYSYQHRRVRRTWCWFYRGPVIAYNNWSSIIV